MKKLLAVLSLLALITAPAATFAKNKNELREYTVGGLKLARQTGQLPSV